MDVPQKQETLNQQKQSKENKTSEILDTDCLANLQKHLQLFREQRVKLENETKDLENRVNCLTNEKEKSLKQLEEKYKNTNKYEQYKIIINEILLQRQKDILNSNKQNNIEDNLSGTDETKKHIENENTSNKQKQTNNNNDQQNIPGEKRKKFALDKKNRIKDELMKRILEEEKRIEVVKIKKKKLEEEEIEIKQELIIIKEKQEIIDDK